MALLAYGLDADRGECTSGYATALGRARHLVANEEHVNSITIRRGFEAAA
jgi:hypothetical protein